MKNIPAAVNKRLSNISANEKIFNESVPPFQNALSKSGYSYKMKFEAKTTRKNVYTSKRNRKRNIIWFNPPWTLNCKTRVAATFLELVKKCFHSNHPLHKIFNRNTLKVSYSCLPNFSQVINSHNTKIRKENQASDNPSCNCKGGPTKCPLNGACQTKCLVYGAKVTNTRTQTSEFYTGVTARRFKDRLYEHQTSFNKRNNKKPTTLSDHIWKLKDQNEPYSVSWWIKDRGRVFNPTTKSCDICDREKFHIMFHPETATLNSRSEIYATCTHRRQQLLSYY